MPRSPEKRRGPGRPRGTKKQRDPDPVLVDEDGNENDDGDEPEDDDGDDDSGEELGGEDGENPELEPDPVPARSQVQLRTPTVADIQEAFKAEGAQNLGSFVARFAEKVERDPENHAFELFRVRPKVDEEGNPCEGYVATFQRPDLLTYAYLQRKVMPGHYTLCFRGINAKGQRGGWLGVLNGLRIAEPGKVADDPIEETEMPAQQQPSASPGGSNGQGRGPQFVDDPYVHRPPTGTWGGRRMLSEQEERLERVPMQPQQPQPNTVLEMAREKLLRDALDRSDGWAKEAVNQAQQRPAVAPPPPQVMQQPSADPQVTTKALELLSDAAKAGPREQSATEQRLLEQINALRDDLAKLQARHVDELSKMRTDHVQELLRERDSSTKAREDLTASYERRIEAESKRSDELRSGLTTQHQAFVSSLEAQQRAHVEAVRTSLEARNQALADQLAGLRDELGRTRTESSNELNRIRTESSNELSRIRQELSEEKTRSMTGQHDLVLAKVEAKTAEVKGQLAGDSLSSAGKMIASVKGFAEALGYTPAGAQAAAPAEEAGVGATVRAAAGAATTLFGSEGFTKLAGVVAERLRGAGGPAPTANPAVTAAGVDAWAAYRNGQRQAPALPAVPAVPRIEQVATPAVVASQPRSAPVDEGAAAAAAGTQDAIEDAALMGETPEVFVQRIVQAFGIDLSTLQAAVRSAPDADVWGFLQVNPVELSSAGRTFAASVLTWLRSPSGTSEPASTPTP